MVKEAVKSLVLLILAVGAVQAQTSYPMLMTLEPIAIQVGTTSEMVVKSRYSMWGANKVMVSGNGVTGVIVHPEPPMPKKGEEVKEPSLTSLTVTFTASPDAQPGVRDFKIFTHRGVSTVGQIVITRDPVVWDDVKTDTMEGAKEFQVPATLTGVFEKNEDLDYFKFSGEAGQRLVIHCRCMRLQDRIHDLQTHADPIITVKNHLGSTIAASDNYFAADPYLVVEIQQSGEYYLEVRDVRYKSNAYWNYAIEVIDRPFPTNAFPLAIAADQPATFELIGESLAPGTMASFDAFPIKLQQGRQWLSLPAPDGNLYDPIPVYVSDEKVLLEDGDDNDDVEHAQLIEVPAVVNGRMDKEADIDYYRFEAKKGDTLAFEVIARRSQSMLDSFISIENEEGKRLNSADDYTFGRRSNWDSRYDNCVVPADGVYHVSIYDRHLRGGPEFVYALEISRSAPTFELTLDTDKTLTTPGTSGVLFVRAKRLNGFAGEIQLHVDDLPTGVTASLGKILATGQDGCIVLTANGDAPFDAQHVRVYGSAVLEGVEGEETELLVDAAPYQEIYMPGGGRNHYPVDVYTVSVQKPSDIRNIKISTNEVNLKPGEEVKIEVELDRAEGFDANISLDVIYQHLNVVWGNSLPKGVKMDGNKSKVLLTSGELKGHVTLVADDTLEEADRQQFCIMANVSLNFVMKATYTSEPLFITTTPKAEEEASE